MKFDYVYEAKIKNYYVSLEGNKLFSNKQVEEALTLFSHKIKACKRVYPIDSKSFRCCNTFQERKEKQDAYLLEVLYSTISLIKSKQPNKFCSKLTMVYIFRKCYIQLSH